MKNVIKSAKHTNVEDGDWKSNMDKFKESDDKIETIISNANNEILQAETILSSLDLHTSGMKQEVLDIDIDTNFRRLERSQEEIKTALERYKWLKNSENIINDKGKIFVVLESADISKDKFKQRWSFLKTFCG